MYAQVFRFRLPEAEADDYGNGKIDNGIHQRFGGICQLKVDGKEKGQQYTICVFWHVKMQSVSEAVQIDSVDILIGSNMVVVMLSSVVHKSV